jgi:hypothetical protein
MDELQPLNPAERSRVYTFPGGETVRLENVTHFLARESGTHRLKTGDGMLHIVRSGWLHIAIDADGWTA